MSAVVGDIATLCAAGGLANKSLNGNIDGRVKVSFDTYTCASLAQGSTIKMCQVLPTGAKIVNIKVQNAALGGSVTFSVGDSNTAARYISAADGNSAAAWKEATAGMGYVIGTASGDNQILITTAGATATGLITIEVTYTMD